MRVIDSMQSERMKGAHGDKLAYAKTRVCITRNAIKIREHLARQKETDVRVAIQRHEENMNMYSTKTVVSIYSTVYRAFLGISALEEYMEEAPATLKNDKCVTGGARQPKRTKKTSATLTRYRTNMNITEQATVQEWLQAMQVEDH